MLDPQLQALMSHARAAGIPDLCELPPAACRGLYRQLMAGADVPPADVQVQSRRIPAAGGRPSIGLRCYTPRSAGTKSLVVYFHGGGYVVGDLDAYDNVCRQLSIDSDSVVVAVDYRLAPEHPFPAAVDDAWAALQWLAQRAHEFGADAGRLAVAGDSAGAVLATVGALLARDAGGPSLCCQALVYPPAAGGHDGHYPSRQAHAAGPTLTGRTMDYFGRHYFGELGAAPDWRGAPLLASDLSRLPPTLLMLAAHDPLRDEAMAFGAALLAAGNATTIVEYHGLAHGFIGMGGAVGAARLAQLQLGAALRQALSVGT